MPLKHDMPLHRPPLFRLLQEAGPGQRPLAAWALGCGQLLPCGKTAQKQSPGTDPVLPPTAGVALCPGDP